MNKRKLISGILISICMTGTGQTTVNDLPWDNEQCKYFAETLSVIFANHLRNNQIDSATAVLEKWEQNCRSSEPVLRAKIILALKTNSFNESLYNETILESIINFDNRLVFSQQPDLDIYYLNYQTYFGFIPFNSYFDQVMNETARDLNKQYGENSVPGLFTRLYSNDPDSFFIRLKDPATDGTYLKQLYQKEITSLVQKPVLYASFYLGTLIPAKINSVLGIHPVAGVKLGIKPQKITYNLMFEGRFGNTRQKYNYRIKEKDSLIVTSEFIGALMGFELGYEIFKRNGIEINLAGGGGYEIARTAFYPEDYTDDVTINTYNVNAGLTFRKYIKSSAYIDLTAKYNYVDYTLNKQSNLGENYFSLTLQLGYFGDKKRDARLNKLRYNPGGI